MKKDISDLAIFGGNRLFHEIKSTSNLAAPPFAEFLSYANSIFETRQLTNNGPLVQELERRLAELHEVKYCVATCSGFMALLLTISALALPGKSEVLIPSMTYRRLGDIVRWAGLTPCCCDMDASTLAVDPKSMKAAVCERTALLLPAHPITNLCDIDALEQLADEHGLPLLFDSVEAAFASHNGRMVGSFGAAEVFSMHASKLLNSFEGGYITTNDAELAERLRRMRGFGFKGKDNIVELGHNAKLNELHAAMALACLDNLDEQIKHNKEGHLLYQDLCNAIPGLYIVPYDTVEKRGWKNVVLHIGDDWPLTRDQTIKTLHAEGMLVRPYYSPPLHIQYRHSQPCPMSEKLAREYLLMPSGAFINTGDIRSMADLMRFLQKCGHDITKRLGG